MAWASSNRISSAEYKRNRDHARNRDQGCCVRCLIIDGLIVPARDCDHWISQAQGGSDNLDNLWMLCGACHDDKTAQEAAGRSGFRSRIDYSSGWAIDEPDWKKIIEDRTKAYWAERTMIC
ncbi:HNH endonuclease [Pseudogemmobacter bohemicus]|uniref:HNH endonuclease n=1 Tax=Pseudogemmobacter bohemicus TaxID=2250708 RepID=UPI000DD3FC07